MIKKYVEAISAGQIVSVDWRSIKEMLGENAERTHACAIYIDDGSFPPAEKVCSDQFTEKQIGEFLQQADVRFMAESHKDGMPHLPIEARYFSSAKPISGPWIESPNYKA